MTWIYCLSNALRINASLRRRNVLAKCTFWLFALVIVLPARCLWKMKIESHCTTLLCSRLFAKRFLSNFMRLYDQIRVFLIILCDKRLARVMLVVVDSFLFFLRQRDDLHLTKQCYDKWCHLSSKIHNLHQFNVQEHKPLFALKDKKGTKEWIRIYVFSAWANFHTHFL